MNTNKYFKDHPSVDVLYITSDDLAFFDKRNAENHARYCMNGTVTEVRREQVNDNIMPSAGKQPEQNTITYIFKYTSNDGKFLGYHMNTFRERTNDFRKAKRYGGYKPGESADGQIAIIRRNLTHLYKEDTDIIEGYAPQDIDITAEELAPSIIARFPVTYIYEEIK